jgi:hypothetical protein
MAFISHRGTHFRTLNVLGWAPIALATWPESIHAPCSEATHHRCTMYIRICDSSTAQKARSVAQPPPAVVRAFFLFFQWIQPMPRRLRFSPLLCIAFTPQRMQVFFLLQKVDWWLSYVAYIVLSVLPFEREALGCRYSVACSRTRQAHL